MTGQLCPALATVSYPIPESRSVGLSWYEQSFFVESLRDEGDHAKYAETIWFELSETVFGILAPC